MQTTPAPMCRIDIYSHFFTITHPQSRVTGLIYRLALQYTKYEFRKVAGKTKREAGSVYGVVSSDRVEHRFHIGQLPEFVKLLDEAYITPDMYTWHQHSMYTPDLIDVEANPKYVLRQDQTNAQNFILSNDVNGDKHTRFISMPPGSGKSQPLDALLKVPKGWKKMGDIKRGESVTAADGTDSVVEGVYPQGELEVISFSFEDGRTSESSLDHFWKVCVDNFNWQILTTAEIIEFMEKGRKCYIPLRNHKEENINTYLPMDPFLFGKLISEKVNEVFVGATKDFLSKIGLFDEDNIIPDVMFTGSSGQRRQVLRALIGENPLNEGDDIICHYKDPETLRGIQKLVWSLGGIAKIEGEAIRISHLRTDTAAQRSKRRLQLVGYSNVGKKPCQCITIRNSERLYLTDNYIVTHNTVVSLVTTAHEADRSRVMITMLGKYMKKWPTDVTGITNTPADKVMTIEGSAELMSLIAMANKKMELPNYIIFSMDTLVNFYKAYLDNREAAMEMYGCHPQKLPELLGAGKLIIDEAHEHFHKVFHVLIFNHIPKIIGLSGTLLSQDPFMQQMHKTIFPRTQRFEEIVSKKYVKSFSFGYSFLDMKGCGIRTTERGDNKYSHSAFEASIIGHKRTFENYLRLIGSIINFGYVKDYIPGDRFVVFVRRRDMATFVAEFLKKAYPQFNVKRYLPEDDYQENMLGADIRVTTIQSGGTAHDIPNLRGALLTIAMQTIQGNLQGIGRLRDLPDRDVKFFTMHSYDIDKHIKYHRERMTMVDDRTLFYKEFRTTFDI